MNKAYTHCLHKTFIPARTRHNVLRAFLVSIFLLGCTRQCQTDSPPRPHSQSIENGLTQTQARSDGSAPLLAPSSAPQNDHALHLVFLGDSLTAGYELPAAESFPAQVEKTLKEKGLPWKVVNAGVSGDTTAGALARLDWVLRTKPDLLFICLGANDGLRGLKLSETEKNLREIIRRTKQNAKQVVLAGMLLPSNYGPDYTVPFGSLFPKLAQEFQIPFLPFLVDKVALVPELTLADGIHPNAAGAKKIASRVVPFLEPLLSKIEQDAKSPPIRQN